MLPTASLNEQIVQEPVNLSSTWNRIIEIFKRTMSSPLFWVTLKVGALIGTTITLLAFPALIPVKLLAPIVGVGLATLGIEIYLLHKPLAYEILVYYGLFDNWVRPEGRPWWSEITENVILGAIPLKNKNHIEKLEKKGITSVLSLLELFEFSPKLLTVPANHTDWSKRNIKHKHIPAEDFTPLPVHVLAEAVDYVHNQVKSGEKIYIHCKSGVGRSTMVVVGYLLKYHPHIHTIEKALSAVKERRPQVHLNEKQIDTLKEYLRYIAIARA